MLDTDHNLTLTSDVTLSTPQDDVFGDNTSCLLWPDIGTLAEGPYCKPVVTEQKSLCLDRQDLSVLLDSAGH